METGRSGGGSVTSVDGGRQTTQEEIKGDVNRLLLFSWKNTYRQTSQQSPDIGQDFMC